MENVLVLLITIFRPIANGLYFLFKLAPVKNRISFLSRQSNKPSLDFELLAQEIQNLDQSVEIRMSCARYGKSLVGTLRFMKSFFTQMLLAATSRIVILDGYNPVICFLNQRNNLFVIQIWHALGAIKKFSYQSLDKPGGRSGKIARALRMHHNYDIVTCGSEYFRPVFAEAFNIPVEKIKVMPLPRVDYLRRKSHFGQNNDSALNNCSRKTVLYVPTFRDNAVSSINVKALKELSENCERAGFNLIVSLHQRSKDITCNGSSERFLSPDENIFDTILASDFVITDYSAIAFEVAAAGKVPWFYVYDYEDYKRSYGFNIELRNIGEDQIFDNATDLVDGLMRNSETKEKAQVDLSLLSDLNETETQKMAHYILGKLN